MPIRSLKEGKMRAVLFLFCIFIFAKAGYPRFIPFPEGYFEYVERYSWIGRLPGGVITHSRIKRWISPVHTEGSSTYQSIKDSVFDTDSTYVTTDGSWKEDSVVHSRDFRVSYTEKTVDFDMQFTFPFSASSPYIRFVDKYAFDSPASLPGSLSDTLKVENGYFRRSGDSIACVSISVGNCCPTQVFQSYSEAVFSQYGLTVFIIDYSDWSGGRRDSLALKKAVIGKDTVVFGNTSVVGIQNTGHDPYFGSARLASKAGPARVGLYSLEGKLLRSWVFGPGEEIKPG